MIFRLNTWCGREGARGDPCLQSGLPFVAGIPGAERFRRGSFAQLSKVDFQDCGWPRGFFQEVGSSCDDRSGNAPHAGTSTVRLNFQRDGSGSFTSESIARATHAGEALILGIDSCRRLRLRFGFGIPKIMSSPANAIQGGGRVSIHPSPCDLYTHSKPA